MPTPWKIIPRGRGFQKLNFFKQKHDTKMEFPGGEGGGGGFNLKKPSVGGYGYFLEQHIINNYYS